MKLKKRLGIIEQIYIVFTFCILILGILVQLLFNFVFEMQQLYIFILNFFIIICFVFLIPVFYRFYYIKKYTKDIYKVKKKYKKWLFFIFIIFTTLGFAILYILNGWENKYIILLIIFIIVFGIVLKWIKQKD